MSTLSFSLPTPSTALTGVSASADATATPASPSDGGAGAGAFAGVLAAAQEQLERQDLAASTALPVPALMTQSLGSGLNLITPASAEPATDSLLAFARSQGLDEGAIAALWGPSLAPAAGLSPAPSAPSGPGDAATAPWMPTGLALPGVSQALVLPTPAGPGALTAAAGPNLATPGPQSLTAPTLAPATGLNGLLNAQLNAQPWALSAWHAAPPPPAGLGLPPGATTPPGNEPEALPEASEWGLLASRLLPTPGKPLRNNPSLNLDAPGLANPLANPATAGAPTGVEVLDLQADVAQVLALAQAQGPDTPLEARPGSFGAPALAAEAGKNTTPSAPAPSLVSGYQLKMEHFAQLADRLGVALAQRLQQQIERGQWSLQLRLNPAELGQVDVRLDMRSSGLEAVFQADNPLTRELLAQGAGRLREGLTQSGMIVASVWVNSEGGRQSGGNPTPQRQPRSGPADTDASVAASPVGLQPRPHSADGWDVLA